jgi:transcriptional regulator with PAS, ATPase and Fis domain
MAKEGKFRMDLYFRLCDMEIELIPYRKRTLEERRNVIHHFNKKAENKWGYSINIAVTTKNIIENYSFPGNFREIWSVCNGLYIWKDKVVEPEMLPKRMTIKEESILAENYQIVMKKHFESVYEKYKFDLNLTCKALGYKNTTQLKKKFEDLGIINLGGNKP